MTHVKDGTKLMPHGLFYMENAGGHGREIESNNAPPIVPTIDEEHQPSCFALEEEKGEGWQGGGASTPAVKETKPSL